ncbi:MAG TPA: glutamine synthetase family protein [Thermodesulfobacteriota bacterium]
MSEETRRGRLTVDGLRQAVAAGEIDTVVIAMVDMQGRLQGKRLDAEHFLDTVLEHKAEGCNYQLTVDVEMNPVPGYRHASWSTGYGDFVFAPDLSTLRRIPWLDGTALVLCDLEWEDGRPVVVSPRQILRRQIERLAERGLVPIAATELEFMVFRNTYQEAWASAYRGLTPATLYNVDYALLDTVGTESLMRDIRRHMRDAGLEVQGSKGECNRGQYEINFTHQMALGAADTHVIFKNGAKEIAARHGAALTFMAKFDEREGNSCHIHFSVRSRSGEPVMADGHELSKLGRHFVAGLLAAMADLTLFFAPNINSYKRYAKGSFAPTALAWGRDNRTCALRLVGRDDTLRVENRVPGGDANPYLALAAMIAAGIHGLDEALPLEPAYVGNAYESDAPRVPRTLRDARERFLKSAVAREAFGEEVVEHYARMAEVEIEAFDAAITDWERFRCFERM